jgi:DNA-cytosine methyltransferase
MKALSLFSGCGGLDLGFVRSGGTITAAYEFDAKACAAYERMMGHSIHQVDLSQTAIDELPDSDGIIGGPPCQAFSNSNRARSGDRGPDSSKNLWPATLAIVKAKRPAWFVFENVKGLVFSKDSRRYFHYLIDELTSYGYRVEYRILDAADYGVPQNRERVFIVGRRDGQAWQWPEPTHSERRTLFTQRWVAWDDALREWTKTAVKKPMPNWTFKHFKTDLPADCYVNTKDNRNSTLYRVGQKPSFTVMTQSARYTRIIVDRQIYGGDTRAMAILQTLPFVDQPAHTIGNAVPPLLAQAVFSAAS